MANCIQREKLIAPQLPLFARRGDIDLQHKADFVRLIPYQDPEYIFGRRKSSWTSSAGAAPERLVAESPTKEPESEIALKPGIERLTYENGRLKAELTTVRETIKKLQEQVAAIASQVPPKRLR